jgi:hydroxyacylglutathione hydrolase
MLSILPLKSFSVTSVPCLSDNYAYIIRDAPSGNVAVVDPVEPEKVLEKAKTMGIEDAQIKMILTTHKHWDHAGGNEAFVKLLPHLEVITGLDEIKSSTRSLADNEKITLGELTIQAMHTPCHTSGHTCYLISAPGDEPEQAIMTGDTLFTAGVGRFFEGTHSHQSI